MIVIALTQGGPAALALGIAVLTHELGHYLVARVLQGRAPLRLQVGSGRAYLKGVDGAGPTVAVLAAGPVFALIPFTASLYLEYFGAAMRQTVILWTLYQLLPFPTLDGGQLLGHTVLARVKRNVVRWRILWALGLLTVLLLAWWLPGISRWLMYFTLMAILLGRGAAGPMRYADAYEAWQAGDHRGVVGRALAAPRYLNDDEIESLALLGMASARALDDPEALDELAHRLVPHHPERLRAAEHLLREGRSQGLRLAREAFDYYDSGRVSPADLDEELWADLAFHYARAEAAGGQADAALSLLERAATFGFDHLDRLEADPQLGRLQHEPRYQAVRDRLLASASGP